MTTKTTVSLPSNTEIVTERIFNAPRQVVYDTFTDPALIPEWWGPRGTKTVVDQMDVRTGGKWRFVHDPGTEQETAFRGEYREVNPPESVTQTFEWEGMPGHVIVETAYMEDLGDGRTKLRTVSTFASVEDRDGMLQSGMESGLQETHDRFEELLARIAA
jgi:uncharacterized protein YndB with AHSA1/START domain